MMTKREQIKQIKKRTIELDESFGEGCFVCGVMRRKGMTFHHITYDKVHYTGIKDPLEYAKAVYEEVSKHPSRFLLLCAKHHHGVEAALRYNETTWRRYTAIRDMHATARGNHDMQKLFTVIMYRKHGNIAGRLIWVRGPAGRTIPISDNDLYGIFQNLQELASQIGRDLVPVSDPEALR